MNIHLFFPRRAVSQISKGSSMVLYKKAQLKRISILSVLLAIGIIFYLSFVTGGIL